MKVLFASSEAAPFFKSGGLGDVAGALPKELKKKGVDVRVVLPLHALMKAEDKKELQLLTKFTVKVGWRVEYTGIKTLKRHGITYYFIDNERYFMRDALYGYEDDGLRFSYFSIAVLEMLEKIGFIPDVIHANDWHTALIPVLLKEKYQWIDVFADIRTVLTIHNLQFQGVYDQRILADWLGIGMDAFQEEGLKYYDKVNFLKGGIQFADAVNTVSPTYAEEIQTPHFGENLDAVLRANNHKLQGILNGIDYETNNPKTDPVIYENFNVNKLAGKKKNKTGLQKDLQLPESDDMLIGVVSRLTTQKGFNLVEHILDEIRQRPVQVVILGTGEAQFENTFRYFDDLYPDKVRAVIDFDIELAQKIYAGSDLFLMPSAFEPCGLSQMLSMRYGTLPLVHEVGGLKDTVAPYNKYTGEGTGFSFYDFSPHVLLQIIDEALDVYQHNPKAWTQLIKQAMNKDFSWDQSAQKYISFYQSIQK